MSPGDTVAFDGNLASVAVAQAVQNELEPLGIQVNGHLDLLDPIWENRPELPQERGCEDGPSGGGDRHVLDARVHG